MLTASDWASHLDGLVTGQRWVLRYLDVKALTHSRRFYYFHCCPLYKYVSHSLIQELETLALS